MEDHSKYIQVNDSLEQWLAQEDLDRPLREELLTLLGHLKEGQQGAQQEIYERFYRELEFGTGGLRGILGAGTNRMNIYTVRKATQGLADYINLHYGPGGDLSDGSRPKAAISYDSRIQSDRFALEAAGVLAANGIKVYLYPALMPTPALSFAVRHYHCSAGIMVTASHNPAIYNGYKVYNSAGCQMTLEAAAETLAAIEKVDLFQGVKYISFDMEDGKFLDTTMILDNGDIENDMIEMIPQEVTEAFYRAVKSESLSGGTPDGTGFGVKGLNSALKVVYTPLNGTGNLPVRQVLASIGITDVTIVKEQELPDGNFPTCPYPNPEKKEALALGLALCQDLAKLDPANAPDLLLATDPDADRVGIAVRHQQPGKDAPDYVLLSGNEVGLLLLDFICKIRTEAAATPGKYPGVRPMPKDPVAIKTIVSSRMATEIAKAHKVELIDVLTGFKFIGEQVGLLEEKGEEDRYIFGFEESYGYLSGSYVRDKDAVNGAMLICEAAAWCKDQGKTLVDYINELYETYGFYRNDLLDITFEGAAGMEKMAAIMAHFRGEAPVRIAGSKVIQISDYGTSQLRVTGRLRVNPNCGMDGSMAIGTYPIKLPKSDVLEYVLDDASSIIIRPSGTEPKLKIYISAKADTLEESLERVAEIAASARELLNEVK